jgi:uncharacterized membrane protein
MVFKLLSRIPLFGDVLRILNTYAYKGDPRADEQFASPWLWLKAFWAHVLVAAGAAALCVPELTNRQLPAGYCLRYVVTVAPGTTATSILPNLLGFGIGVYALIFGLHKLLLRELQDSYKPQPGDKRPPTGSALILNAEMAVPLLVLALTIVLGLVQQIWAENEPLKAITWFALWLSLTFTVELICTLFGLGENSILKSLAPDDTQPPT